MEIIRLSELEHDYTVLDGLSIALGQFDGLHLAHQLLIEKAVKYGKENDIKTGIMTFDPHPDFVLGKSEAFSLITPIKTKMELLEEIGIDYVFLVEFNKNVASMEPRMFCQEYLLDLNVKHVVCGFDFRYGRYGKGKAKTLEKDCHYHITVEVVDEVMKDNLKVGTQRIKDLLNDGDIDKTNELLDRFYHVEGIVATGNKLGRTMNFPTANIRLTESYVLPKLGVYAVLVKLNGDTFKGMCNIGFNPTFNLALKPKIEVHILDFNQDIYGKTVRLYFIKRIRDEHKFGSKDELMKQLELDKINVFNILEEYM